MAVEDLTKALDDAGVQYELLTHERTESAAAEAQALGLPADDVAKTLIVKTRGGYLRVVLPAPSRLDERKLRDLTGGRKEDVRLATEDELRSDYRDFDLGAVPPIGGARADSVIVDSRVAARESVVLEAGSHEQSVRLAGADIVRAAGAQVADLRRED
jgi:prolyl-tRNA editing enzyme YbaK/EbsC (Cys-tRNA(Pro) deacylase)